MNPDEVIKHYRHDAERFDGDKALFWAGRMSMLVRTLEESQLCVASKYVTLISLCATEYDKIIFARVDTIADGHGSAWSIVCPDCGKRTMHVVRPGKVQCGECG